MATTDAAPQSAAPPSTAPPSAAASDAAAPDAERARALRRAITVVVLGSVMSVLDTTIVNVALPRLSAAFHAPLPAIQWAVTGYTLALAAVIPISGWAMARLGARRTYLTALVLFTAGSVLAATAWSAPSLVAFRVVQGLGGGLLMPVGMAMVMRLADRDRMGRTMALLGLPILVGPAAGPVLGGLLVDAVSWRWIFLINLPVGVLAVVLAVRLLRPDAPSGPAPRPDIPGLLLLSPGLALLIFGLARGGEHGAFGSPSVYLPTAAGAAMAGGFVARALTARRPLLDLRLFRDRAFAAGIGTLALFSCAYFGSMLLSPVYWQGLRGFRATTTGLIGMPVGLTVGITMQLAARRIDRVSPRRLIPVGIALAAAGVALTAAQLGPETPVWRMVGSAMVMGTGAGMVLMPTMATATRGLPPEKAAAASTALGINSQLAASVGTALISVVLGASGGAADPGAFRVAYGVTAGLFVLCLAPALLLPGRRQGSGRG